MHGPSLRSVAVQVSGFHAELTASPLLRVQRLTGLGEGDQVLRRILTLPSGAREFDATAMRREMLDVFITADKFKAG